jgi:hypothetical protein
MEFSKLEKENKFILFSAAAAFALSFLLGVIARNPPAVALVRALVSSALFGGIMLGAVLVVKRYLPGVLETRVDRGTAPAGEPGEQLGSRVDYSVAEEGEPSPLHALRKAQEEREGVPAWDGDLEPGGGEGEEPEQGGGGAYGEDTGAGAEEGLPSLDRLFDEQERDLVPNVEEQEQRRPESRKGDYLYVRDARFPNDPETIAKAIKKVMKQDEH